MTVDKELEFEKSVAVLCGLRAALAIRCTFSGNIATRRANPLLHSSMDRVDLCEHGYTVNCVTAASFSSERLALCALTCCVSLSRSAGCTCRHTTPCAVPGCCAFLA
jgi:hypothetical protein